MGLYERLLQEAAQEEQKEDPGREKRQRMHAYIRSRRRVVPSGGYVTSEEVQQDQERHLADMQALCALVNGGVRSMGASYRLAYLRRKYPVEYAHLRDIEISSR